MSCQFIINYPKPKEILVQQLEEALRKVNGRFAGDVAAGSFEGNTPIGAFSGSYRVVGDDIEVTVDKKPFLIGCSRIESEIRNYLG
jgi:hypothetical protein